MTVLRIVPNIASVSLEETKRFYDTLFDMDVVMDHGWIFTLSSGTTAAVQISMATEGGSGTPVPDISIEVSDVDQVHQRAVSHGAEIVYGLTDEPWGVRRFYVRDPAGKVLNVLSHLRS